MNSAVSSCSESVGFLESPGIFFLKGLLQQPDIMSVLLKFGKRVKFMFLLLAMLTFSSALERVPLTLLIVKVCGLFHSIYRYRRGSSNFKTRSKPFLGKTFFLKCCHFTTPRAGLCKPNILSASYGREELFCCPLHWNFIPSGRFHPSSSCNKFPEPFCSTI